MGFTTLSGRKPVKGIQGHYLAFYEDDQPVVLYLDDQPFVGLFSSPSRLAEAMHVVSVRNYRLKQVASAEAFLDSLDGQQVRICLDPRVVGGKTRFTELVWEEAEECAGV